MLFLLQMTYLLIANADEQRNSTDEPQKRLPYRDPRIEENTMSGERVWKSMYKVKEMSRGPASRKLSQKHSNSQPPVQKLKHGQLDVFHPFSNIHGINETTNIDRATIARLHNQAQDGSVDSSYFLGLIYLYGLHFSESNAMKASKWFKDAAEQGHSEAQCALGLLLYDGIGGVGKDRKTAMRWFYQCASSESEAFHGHWLLGRALYEGLTFEDIGVQTKDAMSVLKILPGKFEGAQDPPSAFILAAYLFQKAENVHQAIHYLAIMFEYGLVPNDFPGMAIPPVSKNTIVGNDLSSFYSQNFEKAAELYKKASRMGSIESLYNLALMYTYGRGVPLNYARAVDLFRQATFWKHAPSMHYLGKFALKGWGRPNEKPNVEDAMSWLTQCIHHSITEERKHICEEDLSELEQLIDKAESNRASVLKHLE